MTGQKNRFSTTEKLWNLDDKQLKTPKHDAMVLWLMDENNLKPLIKDIINYKTCYYIAKDMEPFLKTDIRVENPIKSSPTFIAGYADLIYIYEERIILEENICPFVNIIPEILSIKNPELMKEKCQEYGLSSISEFKTCHTTRNNYHYKEEKIWDFFYNTKYSDVFDLKLYCDGERVFHQESVYKWALENEKLYKFQKEYLSILIEVKPYIDSFGAVLRQIKSYENFTNKRYYCIFTLDDRFDAQFESQNIKVLHPPEDVTIDDMMEMFL